MANMASDAKSVVNIPVIAVGRLDVPELGEQLIREGKADMIAIGADSKKCDLEEPTPDEVRNLIEQLRGTTKIFIKGNLKRLVPEYGEGWL